MARLPGEGQYGRDGVYHVWRLRRSGARDIVRKHRNLSLLKERVDSVLHELREKRKIAAGAVTVRKAMTHWLETRVKPNRELNTYLSYEGTCRTIIFPAIGNVRLSRLNADHLQEVVAYAQSKGLGRSARYAPAIMQRCFGKKIVVLLEEVELPPEAAPRDRVYSPDEIERVMKELNRQREMLTDGRKGAARKAVKGETYYVYRHRFLFTLLLNSGLRISECLAVLMFDCDLKDSAIDITKQLEWKPKKVKPKDEGLWKGNHWRLKDKLKGKNRKRRVYLTPEGVGAVKGQLELLKRERHLAGAGYEDNGLLFPTESGSPQRPRTVSRALEDIIERAGIAHGTVHDFRRSYGTYFAKHEPRMHILAAQLGHSSIATTAKHYVWAQELEKKGSAETLVIRAGHQERHQSPSKKRKGGTV